MPRNYAKLQPYDSEENLCTCGDDNLNTTSEHEMIQCTASKVKHCNTANYHLSSLQIQQCSSATGSGTGSSSSIIGDLHSSTNTSFMPTTNFQNFGNHQVRSLDN